MRVSWLLTGILLVVLTGGCERVPDPKTLAQDEGVRSAETILPRFAGAEILSVYREPAFSSAPRQECVKYRASAGVDEVLDYYKAALQNLGWRVDDQRIPLPGVVRQDPEGGRRWGLWLTGSAPYDSSTGLSIDLEGLQEASAPNWGHPYPIFPGDTYRISVCTWGRFREVVQRSRLRS